ncbi:hypothetical protein SAMN05519103_03935 [Rhizobiales bacterium GAS113]|nr:hypothetical protein SAMN05519103_03935 [Rhizobiales bacterium GAS113]
MSWHVFYATLAGPLFVLTGALCVLGMDKLLFFRRPRRTDEELLEEARAERRKALDMIRRADEILKPEHRHNTV